MCIYIYIYTVNMGRLCITGKQQYHCWKDRTEAERTWNSKHVHVCVHFQVSLFPSLRPMCCFSLWEHTHRACVYRQFCVWNCQCSRAAHVDQGFGFVTIYVDLFPHLLFSLSLRLCFSYSFLASYYCPDCAVLRGDNCWKLKIVSAFSSLSDQ